VDRADANVAAGVAEDAGVDDYEPHYVYDDDYYGEPAPIPTRPPVRPPTTTAAATRPPKTYPSVATRPPVKTRPAPPPPATVRPTVKTRVSTTTTKAAPTPALATTPFEFKKWTGRPRIATTRRAMVRVGGATGPPPPTSMPTSMPTPGVGSRETDVVQSKADVSLTDPAGSVYLSPQDNEIADSANARNNAPPNVNEPTNKENSAAGDAAFGGRLNIGTPFAQVQSNSKCFHGNCAPSLPALKNLT